MSILILSCNTGEGHNSTARAVAQYAEAQGTACEIRDALSYWPVGTNRFLCSGHVFLYRNAPDIFGAGYRFFEMVSEKANENKINRELKGKDPQKNAFLSLAKRPSEKLYEDIREAGYEAIVCVHVFASLMMTEIRKAHAFPVPTYFIATDYTCYPGVNSSDFDACFIPSALLTEEFTGRGVKKELLVPTGIPVREEFYRKEDPAEAKRRLNLPADRRLVLLMCGSMGCGPMKETAELLLASLPDDAVLAVVCGRNERLLTQMTKLARTNPRLFPVGFSPEISLYMDAAELIITKAGGLSSTEAAVKHLPIVFIDAIPGLEIHNRDFFCENGFACFGESPEEISSLVCYLLSQPARLNEMKQRIREHFSHRSDKEVYEYIKANAQA